MKPWTAYVAGLAGLLETLRVHGIDGRELEVGAAFGEWQHLTHAVRSTRNTVYLIGNGASASMASHVAADLAKNAHVHTQVFSDLSLITAVGNDLGYEEVFAEPLRRRMGTGDMLVAISSSGQSPNVLRAVDEANRIGGVTVTLSAMDGENRLRGSGRFNFYVPAATYGEAETCHAAILHYWIDRVAAPEPVPPTEGGTEGKDAP